MPFSILDLGEVYVTSETMLRGTGDTYLWVPVHAVLICIEGKYILYDAGCGDGNAPSGLLTKRTPCQYLDAQLEKCGIKVNDLYAAVISHLHEDHFGGAFRLGNIPVYVPEECLPNEADIPKLDYRPLSRGNEPELLPGLKILSLPGHTENLLGLALEEEGKKYLFVSDALYTPIHIGPPIKFPGYPWNDEAYRITAERILNMTGEGWQIVWNHWPIPELKAD